jgi:hypothetical protein
MAPWRHGGQDPQVERLRAPHAGALGEAGCPHRRLQHLEGEPAAVGHVQIAGLQRGTVAINHVEGGDRSHAAQVGRIHQPVLRHQGRHRLQIGASDHCDSSWTQDTPELRQGPGDLMGIQVLKVVGGEDGVD